MHKDFVVSMNRQLYDDALARPGEIVRMEVNNYNDATALILATARASRNGAISPEQSRIASETIREAVKSMKARRRARQ